MLKLRPAIPSHRDSPIAVRPMLFQGVTKRIGPEAFEVWSYLHSMALAQSVSNRKCSGNSAGGLPIITCFTFRWDFALMGIRRADTACPQIKASLFGCNGLLGARPVHEFGQPLCNGWRQLGEIGRCRQRRRPHDLHGLRLRRQRRRRWFDVRRRLTVRLRHRRWRQPGAFGSFSW